MSRINTNLGSLQAINSLNQNNMALSTSMQRLSTGLKINTGQDDPAGLIASENLKAEQTGISTAIDNASRANNILSTADGGLNEVSSLLNQLQGLVTQSANSSALSSDEVQANQLQVDSILSTINRISGSTTFQGVQLLNGNFDYTTSSVGTSAINNLQINAAKLTGGNTQNVVVNVVTSATTGDITSTNSGALSASLTLEISGNTGTEQVSVGSGASLSAVVNAVNGVKASTGVSASIVSGIVHFDSTGYGASQFVGVKAISGATFGLSKAKDTGSDAVVTVNGAAAQTDGTHVSYRSSGLDVDFDLSSTANVAGASKTFGITGGGATFSLGSKVSEEGKASLGLQSVSTGNLGDSSIGYLSSLESGGPNSLSNISLDAAQKILDKAITQVSTLRGKIGAFQKFTIGSTTNSLNVALENVTSAESTIADTDFASETAAMTRAQILVQANTSILSQANSSPNSVLTLLRGS
ncbi:MAG TPA: flagellin [Tepidisphaeraceae bacterium]|jgi:flagellin|nr:flagellin [Tepidisphaeraceae bacterium]